MTLNPYVGTRSATSGWRATRPRSSVARRPPFDLVGVGDLAVADDRAKVDSLEGEVGGPEAVAIVVQDVDEEATGLLA